MSRTSLILFGIIVIIIAAIFLKGKEEAPRYPSYQELINKVDSLNGELRELQLERDSLKGSIDSSKVRVEIIENWYEKELINITNQPIASDVKFFSEYLSENSK